MTKDQVINLYKAFLKITGETRRLNAHSELVAELTGINYLFGRLGSGDNEVVVTIAYQFDTKQDYWIPATPWS